MYSSRHRYNQPSRASIEKKAKSRLLDNLVVSDLLKIKHGQKEIFQAALHRLTEATLEMNKWGGMWRMGTFLPLIISEQFGISQSDSKNIHDTILIPSCAAIIFETRSQESIRDSNLFFLKAILQVRGELDQINPDIKDQIFTYHNPDVISSNLTEILKRIDRKKHTEILDILSGKKSDFKEVTFKGNKFDFSKLSSEINEIREGLMAWVIAFMVPPEAFHDFKKVTEFANEILDGHANENTARGLFLRRGVMNIGMRLCGVKDEDFEKIVMPLCGILIEDAPENWNKKIADLSEKGVDPNTISILLRMIILFERNREDPLPVSIPDDLWSPDNEQQKTHKQARRSNYEGSIYEKVAEFYNYENTVKQQWRMSLRSFLERSLGDCPKEKIRALCLAGVEGGELSVYEDLILPENMIAVEGGSKKAREAFQARMIEKGIPFNCERLEEMVDKPIPTMDVVSIDSHTYFQKHHLKIIQELSLGAHAVLFFNAMASREEKNTQEFLKNLAFGVSPEYGSSVGEARKALDSVILNQVGINRRIRNILGVNPGDNLPLEASLAKRILRGIGDDLALVLDDKYSQDPHLKRVPYTIDKLVLGRPIVLRCERLSYNSPGGAPFNTLMAEIVFTPEIQANPAVKDFLIPVFKKFALNPSGHNNFAFHEKDGWIFFTEGKKELARCEVNELLQAVCAVERPENGSTDITTLLHDERKSIIAAGQYGNQS